MSTADTPSSVALLLAALTDTEHLVPAVLLSEALKGGPVTAGDEPPIEELTGAQALALAVAMINAGVVRSNQVQTAEDMADDVLAAILWVYPTEQQAAYAAVQDLRGVYDLRMPAWVQDALADTDNGPACDHILDIAQRACRDTGPGRRWVRVPGIGVVMFKSP